MDNTLKPVAYTEQMQVSLLSWKTPWHLSHAMKECRAAIFYEQASDAYAYVWMMEGSLFSGITLWNLCHILNICKVAYFHGKLHEFYAMQWRNYSDYESTSLCFYSFTLCANINCIVFELTRSWIETTIYTTWCEFSKYYTTGALFLLLLIRILYIWNIYIHFVYAKQKMHYLQINNMVIDIIETCWCHIHYVLLLMLKEGIHL
jgi:hypothetical protein